jgi:2-oxoglutarate dehydrogenase E2 component (dihydrolipoamide succinyltransferase)
MLTCVTGKARDSKLVMEDLEGGHFSISNPGIFGSLYGTPIIPLGQMAVFNLNSIRERVVPVDGEVKIRPVRSSFIASVS